MDSLSGARRVAALWLVTGWLASAGLMGTVPINLSVDARQGRGTATPTSRIAPTNTPARFQPSSTPTRPAPAPTATFTRPPTRIIPTATHTPAPTKPAATVAPSQAAASLTPTSADIAATPTFTQESGPTATATGISTAPAQASPTASPTLGLPVSQPDFIAPAPVPPAGGGKLAALIGLGGLAVLGALALGWSALEWMRSSSRRLSVGKTSPGGANILGVLFVVMKESINQASSDAKYFLSKLKQQNQMGDALSEQLKEKQEDSEDENGRHS